MIISVVGNAKSIFDKQNGSVIDEGDMVIRFNRGKIIDSNCQGTKTTTYVYSRCKNMHEKFGKVDVWHTLQPSYDKIREQLISTLEAKPSNGIIILEQLKNEYANHKVRIFGFDWKKTPTWYNPRHKPEPGPQIGLHNFDKEREYCLNLIKELDWELY